MLFDLNPGVKRSLVVAGVNRDGPLGDDGTAIDALVNEVNRYPRDLHPGPQCLSDGIDPGKGGQQRRMHIENPIREAIYGLGAENSHESGQHEGLDPRLVGHIADLLREPRPVTAMTNYRRLDQRFPGACQRSAVSDIADHEPEPCKPVVDQGLEVAAGAAGENCEVDYGLL